MVSTATTLSGDYPYMWPDTFLEFCDRMTEALRRGFPDDALVQVLVFRFTSSGAIAASAIFDTKTLDYDSFDEYVDACSQARLEWFKFAFDLDAVIGCLLYTSPSPRDNRQSRMPSSA